MTGLHSRGRQAERNALAGWFSLKLELKKPDKLFQRQERGGKNAAAYKLAFPEILRLASCLSFKRTKASKSCWHPCRVLDMHTEKAGDHNDNHDHADDVENIH